jgi:hypothetical protein
LSYTVVDAPVLAPAPILQGVGLDRGPGVLPPTSPVKPCTHWVKGTHPVIQSLQEKALFQEIKTSTNGKIQDMGVSSEGLLWVFGDQSVLRTPLSALAPIGDSKAPGHPASLAMRPNFLSTGSDGRVTLSFPGAWQVFSGRKDEALQVCRIRVPEGVGMAPGAVAVFDGPGRRMFFANPGDAKVFCLGEKWSSIPLSGNRVQRIAPGTGTSMWVTAAAEDDKLGPALIHLMPGKVPGQTVILRHYLGEGCASVPFNLTLGPDGCMWFTCRNEPRIGRVTPAGDFSFFDLPPGHHAVELVAGFTGLLFFTLEDKNRLGCIHAGQSLPAPVTSPCSWPVPPPPRPRAAKATLGREERHARHEAILKRSEERFLSRLQAQGPSPFGDAGSGPGERKEAARTEAKSPAVPPREVLPVLAVSEALDQLYDANVTLGPSAMWHILNGHGHGMDPERSQFAAVLSTPEALSTLIAQGMREAGDMIGREILVGRRGRTLYLTRCTKPGVGTRITSRGQQPVYGFVVVTDRHWHLGEWFHDVVSAYPEFE